VNSKVSLGDWLKWLKVGAGIGAVVVLSLLGEQLLLWAERFARLPIVLQYTIAVCFGVVTVGLTAWWWFFRRKEKTLAKVSGVRDEQALFADAESLSAQGANVTRVEFELAELQARRADGLPYVAFFGAVSMGKSSLIRALGNHVDIISDVLAGTTRRVERYSTEFTTIGRVELVDAPGFSQVDGEDLALVAREEALRADVVVYVADGDLSRDQCAEIEELKRYEKPIIVALNKIDRLSREERELLLSRLAERVPYADLVCTSTVLTERVIRIDAQGRESAVERPRSAQVENLRRCIVMRLSLDREEIRTGRDTSMLRLSEHKLTSARLEFASKRADELVRSYTQRAIIGALAAVAPGTDLVIQGVLASSLLTELCKVFGVKARDVEIGELLKRAELRARLQWAVGLSITGNALKAFPGLGTVGGGLIHAVAYGLIFEALGRAVVNSLKAHGKLEPADIVARISFEKLGPLSTRAVEMARAALVGKHNE